MAVILDQDECCACGSCVDACPLDALVSSRGTIRVLDDQCAECGECVSECPNDALQLPA